MAAFQKRQGKWRALIRIKGFPPQSATFRLKSDAQTWAKKTEDEIRRGTYLISQEQHTLEEAIDRYINEYLPTKSQSQQTNQTKQLFFFKKKYGHLLLSQMSSSFISQAKMKLASTRERKGKTKGRSPATVNRHLAALSRVFTLATKEWKWVDHNPVMDVEKMPEPEGRVRYLSDEERQRFFDACKASSNRYLFPAVLLAISTGARKEELMTLKWSEVDLERQRLLFLKTKTKERRSVKVTGDAINLLNILHATTAATGYVFPSSKTNEHINLRYPFEKALQDAEIHDFRWHDLRHCTGSYLAMSGATLADIATVLGHKTLTVAKRYTHLSETHVDGVLEKMTVSL